AACGFCRHRGTPHPPLRGRWTWQPGPQSRAPAPAQAPCFLILRNTREYQGRHKLKSGLAPTGVLRQMQVLHNSIQRINIRRSRAKNKRRHPVKGVPAVVWRYALGPRLSAFRFALKPGQKLLAKSEDPRAKSPEAGARSLRPTELKRGVVCNLDRCEAATNARLLSSKRFSRMKFSHPEENNL